MRLSARQHTSMAQGQKIPEMYLFFRGMLLLVSPSVGLSLARFPAEETRHIDMSQPTSRAKKHTNIKKRPKNPPSYDLTLQTIDVGVLFLQNEGEEAPAHKEFGL